ncbi:MAG: hypothetical protein IRY99_23640 [Isosphaeraceae bacterium]|nr:hypothetical protein [Isosphaeraceae bacterium]
MPRSDRPIDGRGWIALAWALGFGLLYGRMIVETRGPQFAAAIRRMLRAGPVVTTARDSGLLGRHDRPPQRLGRPPLSPGDASPCRSSPSSSPPPSAPPTTGP